MSRNNKQVFYNTQSIWFDLKKFINNELKENEVFKRSQFIKKIYGSGFKKTSGEQLTADLYRCDLVTIGILDHISRGKYKKLRNIPRKLTSSKLHNLAHDKTWKSWFLQKEDRLKEFE
jgi:hypothetical protein